MALGKESYIAYSKTAVSLLLREALLKQVDCLLTAFSITFPNPRLLHVSIHLINTIALRGRYYYPHSAGEEIEIHGNFSKITQSIGLLGFSKKNITHPMASTTGMHYLTVLEAERLKSECCRALFLPQITRKDPAQPSLPGWWIAFSLCLFTLPSFCLMCPHFPFHTSNTDQGLQWAELCPFKSMC